MSVENAKYNLTLKKGKLSLEFKTDDKRLIVNQVDFWIDQSINNFLKLSKKTPKKPIKVETKQAQTPPEKKEEAQVTAQKDKEPMPEVAPEVKQLIEANNAENAEQEKFMQILQDKFNSIPNIDENKKPEQTTPIISQLERVLKNKPPQTLLDYLIITSHYFKEHELIDKFSLKQVNEAVLPFSKKPVNHAVVQEAINKNFLEIIPDYTGMADVTEYALSSAGELYYQNSL